MLYPQGAVVIAEDPFGRNPTRPYVVISNSRIPFADEESIAAVVTTTGRDEAIELTDDRFERGELPRQSYVSPWTLVTLKDAMIGKQPARVTEDTVDAIRERVAEYLETSVS